MELYKELRIEKGVTAFIGGGGKTTLIRTLAEELKAFGTVLITTSTHIKVPTDIPFTEKEEEAKALLEGNPIVCVGTRVENGKCTEPKFPYASMADYVLVEADGAKHLPMKAHLSHEPVIPKESNETILVMGSHGLHKTITEAAHRPERFAELAECTVDDVITCPRAATVARKESLHNLVFVNLVEEMSVEEQEELKKEMGCPIVFYKL